MKRVRRFTTAPKAYDGFETKSVRETEWQDSLGNIVREVSVLEEHLEWQAGRYHSGMHFFGTEHDLETLSEFAFTKRAH